MRGPIDFGVWGAVIPNLAYTNLAREVWLEAKRDPYVPTVTTIMQRSTAWSAYRLTKSERPFP